MKGYLYILRCSDDSLYIGSTINLNVRVARHKQGNGANYTKERLPVELVYSEEFPRVQQAYKREKQIQKWTRAKKEALVKGDMELLHKLAECRNESHYKNAAFGSAQAASDSAAFDSTQAADTQTAGDCSEE